MARRRASGYVDTMSIWRRIREAVGALAKGAPLSAVFEKLNRSPEHTVAFTIAVIALGAKMAKADGRVTHDEIAAFREIFHIPKRDEAAAARVYNTARTDIAGFEIYARQVARMFHARPQALRDLLEGLVYIAMADGEYHPAEAQFIARVADVFGVPEDEVRRIRARHVPGDRDPYAVLGADPADSDETLRRRYRELVRDLHPDRMLSNGVPDEARRLAEHRLAAVNAAYEEVRRERAPATC